MVELSDKIEAYFSDFPLRSYPKGQILIYADDTPDHIFYMVSGKVRQYDISYRGDEIVVNVFKTGAFFPLLNAVSGMPNKYFYDAEEDLTVRVAPIDEVISFIKNNPDILFDLLRRVYIGADGLLGRMVHLMSGTAKSRLLYELVIECRRFGEKTKNKEYYLPLNESELAARAGLTRETVSREIRKIKREGRLTVTHNGITIKSLEQLEKMLADSL